MAFLAGDIRRSLPRSIGSNKPMADHFTTCDGCGMDFGYSCRREALCPSCGHDADDGDECSCPQCTAIEASLPDSNRIGPVDESQFRYEKD